ncbi:MAG TPA: hypothetical protein VE172_05215 [Stackebrandtia sp.]|uniref:hypothetical protein n=1 Tax=Stackebrandtia sp. TaxID=2023065 RepID=UPI002D5DC038|nr:hypothetical protein [Stackebrandtia sp.]HZE38194.1 hypothetical protein [Stackebrandtia sp.]
MKPFETMAMVTGNRHKIEIATDYLGLWGITVEPVDLELEEIQASTVTAVAACPGAFPTPVVA